MKRIVLLLSLLFLLVSCNLFATPTPEWEREGWTLIWQDEFDGEVLDPAKWAVEIGGHGWGNNEKQFYTDRTENLRLEDGLLIFEARDEFFVRRNYTSGRIKTQGLFSFTYGRVEARMKLPYGQGMWPAFWMLGENIDAVPWPGCGEIDIMEHIGREPRFVYGTVHGPGYSGASGIGNFTSFPGASLSDAFHTFAIEWEPEEIRWFVDDNQFFTLKPIQVTGEWVFDHPFFILLNLAVGGYWPGDADETTVFPQFLEVDYVRVYQRPELAEVNQLVGGGQIHIQDIQVKAVNVTEGWQGQVQVTVVDEDGKPVSDAKVVGGWVGIVIKGETSALTDLAGIVELHSNSTDKFGEITFCVTSISRSGYTYDKSSNVRNCAKVEN